MPLLASLCVAQARAATADAPASGALKVSAMPVCGLAGAPTAAIPPDASTTAAQPCADWTMVSNAGFAPAFPDAPEQAPLLAQADPPDEIGPPAPEDMAGPRPASSRDPVVTEPVSFGRQIGAVKWEFAAIFAEMTVAQLIVTKETEGFHFQDEGWFGKNTKALGMDKLTHAFNTYMFADFLQHRIEKRTGSKGALAAAALASGLQLYSEFYDAVKVSSGFSIQDVAFNTLGGAFSVLRNTTPGLRDKLDFRLMLVPNSDIYTFKGKRHYAQQRYLFALTLAGFDRFRDSPLRFVELHAGYYGKDFTAEAEAAGRTPKRRLFFGIGLNVKQLLFPAPRSEIGKMAGSTLDYLQIPYTAAHGHVGF